MTVVRMGVVAVALLVWGCGGTSTDPNHDSRMQELVGSYSMIEFWGEGLPAVLDTITRHEGFPHEMACWTTFVSGVMELAADGEYVWHRQMRTDCDDGFEELRPSVEEGAFSLSDDGAHFSYPNPFGTQSTRTAVLVDERLKFHAQGHPTLEFHMVFEKIE
jgi:hypothetical protein